MYVKTFIIITRGIISMYNCYAASGKEQNNKKVHLKRLKGRKKKWTEIKQNEVNKKLDGKHELYLL